jgi:L-malate glycosyltransferase
LRVLHLIPSFHQGGSERQAVQLVRLLAGEGSHSVLTACLDRNGPLAVELEGLDLGPNPEFPLNSFYDANMLRQLRRFARFVRDNRIQAVHTHDFYTNIFGIAAATLAGVPIKIAAKRETAMRSRLQFFAERRAFGWASVVVANSGAVRDYLIAAGVRSEKVQIVYNGIDTARIASAEGNRPAVLQKLGLPLNGHRQCVSIVANMRDPVKNHRMFLRAARAVRNAVPEAAFVLAGEGELTASLMAYSDELGMAGDVFFTGRCSDVGSLLSVSDVCVLSSDSEGFSNAIIEYMAAGRPVVATNVGGASEAVDDCVTGYLVNAGDDNAMAARLIELLRNPAKARAMGDAGRRAAASRFSLEALLSATLELYRELEEKAAKL